MGDAPLSMSCSAVVGSAKRGRLVALPQAGGGEQTVRGEHGNLVDVLGEQADGSLQQGDGLGRLFGQAAAQQPFGLAIQSPGLLQAVAAGPGGRVHLRPELRAALALPQAVMGLGGHGHAFAPMLPVAQAAVDGDRLLQHADGFGGVAAADGGQADRRPDPRRGERPADAPARSARHRGDRRGRGAATRQRRRRPHWWHRRGPASGEGPAFSA